MASKNDSQISNEDIVAELTDDLEKTLVNDAQSVKTNTDSDVNKASKMKENENDVNKIVDEALADDEQHQPSDEDVEEDEDTLKELESSWTEDEKQNHRDESQRLKEEGNRLFTEKLYKEAASIYTQALRTCPLSCTNERSVLYSNRAACRMRQEKRKEAIADCTKALVLNPVYLKALLRRAQMYRETEKLDEALADYQKVLEIDRNVPEARQAVATLPEEIKDRNEKLKTEMMGKLKDLGNVVLRPFGLSTDNFKLVQDPNTGGYNINFQRDS